MNYSLIAYFNQKNTRYQLPVALGKGTTKIGGFFLPTIANQPCIKAY